MNALHNEIRITASFDMNRNCIGVDGEGAGFVKLTTDATQLAPVLTAFAKFKGKAFEVVFKPLRVSCLRKGDRNTHAKRTQTLR